MRLIRARISAKTVAWETARIRAREWADNHDPAIIRERKNASATAVVAKPVDEAFDAFIDAKRAASASEETISKFRTMKKQLTHFIDGHNSGRPEAERVLFMHQITPPLLNQWMATWNAKTYWSKSKKRDNTVAFFDFCLGSKWIRETNAKDKGNPARGMAKIIGQKESSIPTLPFTPAQFNSILEASKRYDESLLTANRKEVEAKGKRLHALINLMRWSGLGITDAVTLQRSRLGADDRLVLYRTKTGNPVTVLLKPKIAQELRNVPPGKDANPAYFFWSGRGQRTKAASTWQKALRRLWKLVTPPLALEDRNGERIQPKSHMFRNTFAVELLKRNVSLEHVAMLLADNPTTVREHYYPWVPALQEQLERAVKSTWDDPNEPVILEDADKAVGR